MQRALEPTADFDLAPRGARLRHRLRESDIESRFAIGMVSRAGRTSGQPRPYVGVLDAHIQLVFLAAHLRRWSVRHPQHRAARARFGAGGGLAAGPRSLERSASLQLRAGHMLSHCRIFSDMRRGVLDRRLASAGSPRHCRPGAHAPPRLTGRACYRGYSSSSLRSRRGEWRSTPEAEFDEAGVGLEVVRLEQDLGVWRTEQSGRASAMASAAALQPRWQRPGTERTPVHSSGRGVGHLSPARLCPSSGSLRQFAVQDWHEDPGAAAREMLGRARRLGWRSRTCCPRSDLGGVAGTAAT